MSKTVIYLLLIVLLSTACNEGAEIARDRYSINPYRLLHIAKYGKSTDTTLTSSALTATDSAFYLQLKLNQYPEYLESFSVRSIAFINDSLLELQILPRDGSFIFLDTVSLNEDNTLENYPDYYYDSVEDYFYQCSGLRRALPGPMPNVSYRYGNTFINCSNQYTDALAYRDISLVGVLDTLIYSFIELPFIKGS